MNKIFKSVAVAAAIISAVSLSAKDRKDITYLEPLPLFKPDGTPIL